MCHVVQGGGYGGLDAVPTKTLEVRVLLQSDALFVVAQFHLLS